MVLGLNMFLYLSLIVLPNLFQVPLHSLGSSDDDEDFSETLGEDLMFDTVDKIRPRFTSTPVCENGGVKLQNYKLPVDNMTALKHLIQFDKTKTLEEFPSLITRDKCIIENISRVGFDFKDGNAWTCTSGAQRNFYNTVGEGKNMKINAGKDGASWYQVTRLRYTNSSSKDLHRLVIFMENSDGVKSELALIQYRFDNEPHKIQVRPQGNSKTNIPFIPTKKTVIQRVASEVCKQASNKRVLHTIEEEHSGLLANSPCDLPRNDRQVRYVRTKTNPPSIDPILEIMNMKEEAGGEFIQRIHVDNNSPPQSFYLTTNN